MSLLSKGIKEGVEAVDDAAKFVKTTRNLLVDSVSEAANSGSQQAKEIAENLIRKYDKNNLDLIADTFVRNVLDKTTVDSLGNKKLTGGTFKEAAEDTAEMLNNLESTYSDGIKIFPGNLTSKEVLDFKTLDNIRSGEGGKKGVDNFLDSIKQFYRVATRPKSLSSEYMGTLGDQKRKTQLKAGAKTLATAAVPALATLGITELLSDEEGKLTVKQKNILKQYENVPEDSSSVIDIRSGTMDKAFSMATKNPSKYIFINKEGLPSIIYKGEEIPANLATNEEKTELMLVPIKKAMGGSMLSRQNYEEGSKAIEVPQEVIRYDDITIALNRALANENLTSAQKQQAQDQFERDMKNIDMNVVIEYARDTGQLGGEDLAPSKMAMGGMMYAKGSLVGKQSELDKNSDGEITSQDFAMLRQGKQEGGSLMVPPEMEGMADDMPVDTYPNIPPEEMAAAQASQLPDAEMEDKYMDFVVNESLDSEEQSYLMNALETDPMLSQIFDKVITTASEFTGAGEVEGPGTGVSDSIPARLSDGEFVFTKKATDQMGADNLQMMMDDAERAFDGGEMRMPKQEGGMMMYNQKDEDPLAYEKIAQDEIKKNMLRANRAPSLLGVN